MEQFHKELTERHAWYARWHAVPYITAVHFAVLIGIGYSIASYTAQATEVLAAGPAEQASHLMQQGKMFEIQNSEGQSMWSECTTAAPQRAVGWHSDPVRFRLVKEPLPRHSDPHPLPVTNARQ